MSRINGEKARAAIARKRRSAQRLKDRELKAKLAGASGAASGKGQAAAPEAGKTAEKPKRAAAAKTPDQLIDELRPSKKRAGSAEKSE